MPTTIAASEQLVTLPRLAAHDKSTLRCRMEGAKLPDNTILEDLQRLARSRVVEPEQRRSGRRRH